MAYLKTAKHGFLLRTKGSKARRMPKARLFGAISGLEIINPIEGPGTVNAERYTLHKGGSF